MPWPFKLRRSFTGRPSVHPLQEILRALRSHDGALEVSAATVHVAAVEQWPAAELVAEDPLRAAGG